MIASLQKGNGVYDPPPLKNHSVLGTEIYFPSGNLQLTVLINLLTLTMKQESSFSRNVGDSIHYVCLETLSCLMYVKYLSVIYY